MREPDRVRENRARRAVERRGYALQRCRRRDPSAWDHGTYQIIDPHHADMLVVGDIRGFGLSLADVEEWLNRTAGLERPVNPKEIADMRAFLINLRDEAAAAINRLDESPPSSESEYLNEKARLMAAFRDLSIMAIQFGEMPTSG